MISQSGDIKYTWRYLLIPLANDSFAGPKDVDNFQCFVNDQCFDLILFLVFVEANNKNINSFTR